MSGTFILEKPAPNGVRQVRLDGNHIGSIVKTDKGVWLAIPLHYRNLPTSSHKLAMEAVKALV